jgi:FdhD protein
VTAASPGEAAVAESSRPAAIERWTDGAPLPAHDRVACEEPLELQLDGTPLAVLMRTPGHDLELALGFLLTERVVEAAADVASVQHESVLPAGASTENVVRATLRPGLAVDLERLRRNFYAGSSCGVCGKASIEGALATAPPLEDDARFDPALLYGLPEQLHRAQGAFAETGGLHAAGLFDRRGHLLVVREDVGRHNAVDKVVGWAAASGRLPLAGQGLLVSGRLSFEIVQKALAARIPLVAAVSAPSSLAVELAAASGMALVGFLRGRSFNAYGRVERLRNGT